MIGQKSQKGADGIFMKRKIYQKLLDWKEKRNGEVSLLVDLYDPLIVSTDDKTQPIRQVLVKNRKIRGR